MKGGNLIEPLAIDLNEILRIHSPQLYEAFSALGRELYFPRGILTQTSEAKKAAHRYNATIGIATSAGGPLHLHSLRELLLSIEPEEAFPYTSTTGIPELRHLWHKHQVESNPRLAGKSFSMPILTTGLTHGLSICADLFCDAGDTLLLTDKMWGNYRMVFGVRRGADIRLYPFFAEDGGLDTKALRDNLLSLKEKQKVLVLLNFPNNPTGYSPYPEEAEAIAEALLDAAEAGANIVACVDDAYTGLFYEEGLFKQSLFSILADLHPRITAIKIDGPTKEDYVWGFRIGFITFSLAGDGDREAAYEALERKVGGLIRGTISKSSTLSQSLLIRAMKSDAYDEDKRGNFELLKGRYEEIKQVLSDPHYADAFCAYPFNSGYFMCLQLLDCDAERLRRHLLEKYGVGVIAIGERDIRIAFSCLEREQIKDLFDILYTGEI
jgi:aspartate/methionine/tyrosine aminotransferase